jgi:hypothetical protein
MKANHAEFFCTLECPHNGELYLDISSRQFETHFEKGGVTEMANVFSFVTSLDLIQMSQNFIITAFIPDL